MGGLLPEDEVRLGGGLAQGADQLQLGLALEDLLLRANDLSESF